MTALLQPPVPGRLRMRKLPPVAESTLPNGLRVLVARRRGIPRFECRLVIPVIPPADGGSVLRVLTETVLSGTAERSSLDIAEALQGMGGALGASGDAETVQVSGSCLSVYRRQFLALFGEVMAGAAFPADEVAVERERVASDITVMRSEAGTVASDALVRRVFGEHPYGRGTPEPEAVAAVRPTAVRRLYGSGVAPVGAVLVVVGDVDPDATIADLGGAFAGWAPAARAARRLAPPPPLTPAPPLLIDRPGAVQTTIRMAGPGVARNDPGYPALALASMIYGGYFTSRLNDNIREQKGYTYGAYCRVQHRRTASTVWIGTDVGQEVTAAALNEIGYELGRMVSVRVGQDELDAARRYIQGGQAMAGQTQAGLAGSLAAVVAAGLPVSWLTDYPMALDGVTVDDVLAAAGSFLAPSGMVTVLVGDRETVAPAIDPLMRVS